MKIEAPSGPEDGERMLFCAHADVDEDHIDISANACVHQPFHWYYVGPDNIVTVEPGGHQTPTIRSGECAGRSTTMSDRKDLSDLFAEHNLWELYRQSKAFYRNRFNRIVGLVAGTLITGFAVAHFFGLGTTSAHRVDFSALFLTWANDGLVYGTTILGFLLAGFAVLFAILRPHTVIALAQITRPGETLYELKLIFVSFIDVFVHYTAFLFWCISYLVAGGKDGPFDFIGSLLATLTPVLPLAITHAVFVAWGVWFLVLVLKLKSFIYTLYQTLLLGMADSLE